MGRYWLRGGTIFDGRGGDGFVGDVLIEDGKLVRVGPGAIESADSFAPIDAKGHWVMPGFIDIHTHYDGEVEIAPALDESVRHGVTTILMGNCGISMVMGDAEALSDMFTRVEGIPSDYIKGLLKERKNWDSPTAYFDHLSSLPLGPNIAMFLGHSTIRSYVMGLKRSLSHDNQPERDELKRMNDILTEALDVGYLGLSVNLLEFDKMDGDMFRSRPTPSVFADWREYRYLFRQLRERDRILQTIPNTANPPTFFSFIWESRGWGRKPLKTSMVAMIDGKAARGIHKAFGHAARTVNRFFGGDVKFQGLPEPFDVFTHGFESPFFEEFESGTAYLHLQDIVERRALLKEQPYRRKFRKEWNAMIMPRVFHRKLRDTRVVSCPDSSLNGRSFRELAEAQGKNEIDHFLDLVAEYGDELRWYTVVGNDRPEELNWIISHPDCHIGFSDAGAHLKNMAHYNFPLRLFKHVLDRQAAKKPTMTLGRAVQRVTKELADWYLLDTGELAEGRRADVVVVNPSGLDHTLSETHEAGMPGLPSFQRLVRRNDEAVPYVFINGKMAWKHGKPDPSLGQQKGHGQLLRANSH